MKKPVDNNNSAAKMWVLARKPTRTEENDMGFNFAAVDHVGARSDVVQGEWMEDSFDFYEAWYVVATDEKGYQVALGGLGRDAVGGDRAEALVARIEAAGLVLNPDLWNDVPAQYGSVAYVESDQGRKDLFNELRAAQDAGEAVTVEDFVRNGVADLG